MPKFVVYEVWTTARIIEAADANAAYTKGEPKARPGLDLCNWHLVQLPPKTGK